MLAVPRGHELEHAETVELGRIDPDALLLLTEGHCFRDQALALCKTGAAAGPADTTATSLETVINLVGAGQGITLMPALAARGAWTTDLGVIVRPLDDSGASRNVHLVYRNAFPRQNFLRDVAQLVRDIAPNTVTVSDGRETVS
jgi:LysR family hydrogen peroxide-inducible transcriptional activator